MAALPEAQAALQNGGSPHDVVETHNGLTRMHVAARNGDAEVLQYLISQGGDVNVEDNSGNGWRNKTPLHWASTGEIIDILIANGADQSWLDGAGKSPLASAAFRNRLSAVKRFVELGANVNARDDVVGNTILMWACTGLAAHFDDDPLFNDREERLKIVRFLVEKGADINGLSAGGETALHGAAKFDAQFVRLLLELGANEDIKDSNGKTPLDWAKELDQQESVDILTRK